MITKNRFKTLICIASLSVTSMGVQADLLEDIKERGEIVIATEARYEPFEMIQDGEIVGYGKDILDEILKDLPGVELNQLDLPFQGILAGLNAERYDFVATSLMMTKKRMDAYAFTNPIADASVALLKRANDDSINSPEDMAGKTAGVQAGSAQRTAILDYEKQVLEPMGENLGDIKEFTDYNEAYAALASHRVDFVPQAIPNLAPIVQKRPDMFALVRPAFGPEAYYGWAGRKDDNSKSLVEFFNQGLLKLQQSGKLDELQQKWFGFTMELPEGVLPEPNQ